MQRLVAAHRREAAAWASDGWQHGRAGHRRHAQWPWAADGRRGIASGWGGAGGGTGASTTAQVRRPMSRVGGGTQGEGGRYGR